MVELIPYFNMWYYILIKKLAYNKRVIFLDAPKSLKAAVSYSTMECSALVEYSLSLLFSVVATDHLRTGNVTS